MVAPLATSLFGLFVTMSNVSVPLTKVHYDVQVKSFASHITIEQTYRNSESTDDLECVYGFPINDQASIVGLTVQIGNRTIESVFRKKDEAFQEYSHALARNDGAYLLDQSDRSDDTYVLSVGRLPPGQECTVSISYVGTLQSVTEKKLRLTIPTSLYPRYNPTPELPKTGAVAPEHYQATVPYYATLTGNIEAVSQIDSVTSPSHSINVTTLGPKAASVTFKTTQQALDRDLLIDIDVKPNSKTDNYVEVEESAPGSGEYTALYAFVPQFKSKSSLNQSDADDDLKTELLFLVDCSGSMSEENKVNDARSALQIFLRSIPQGVYFNFFKFGSAYRSLFPESQLYSADTFAQAKTFVDAIDADMGGTEILPPLQDLFSKPIHNGFSRQVFVLTDGEVENTNDVIAIVRQNANTARVFGFGLGQSPSHALIDGIALASNGKAEYIQHGVGEPLENSVGRQLNRALQPAVVGASITIHGVTNAQLVPAVFPPIFRGERQLVYAIFNLSNTTDTVLSPAYLELQIGDTKTKVPFQIPVENSDSKMQPFLAKLAARELIRSLMIDTPASTTPTGSLQVSRVASTGNDILSSSGTIQEQVTSLSLKYGVLSKYVSLVAVEVRNSSNSSRNMQLRDIPIQRAQNELPQGDVPDPALQFLSSPGVSMASSSNIWTNFRAMGGAMQFQGLSGATGGLAADAVRRMTEARPNPSFVSAAAAPELLDSSESLSSTDSVDNSRSGSADDVGFMIDTITTTTTDASTDTPLRTLLSLQQWNGMWVLNEELARLGNLSLSQVKAAATPDITSDDELGTVFAVALLEQRFAGQADVWQSIVNKAKDSLVKESNQAAIRAFDAAIRRLLRA